MEATSDGGFGHHLPGWLTATAAGRLARWSWGLGLCVALGAVAAVISWKYLGSSSADPGEFGPGLHQTNPANVATALSLMATLVVPSTVAALGAVALRRRDDLDESQMADAVLGMLLGLVGLAVGLAYWLP